MVIKSKIRDHRSPHLKHLFSLLSQGKAAAVINKVDALLLDFPYSSDLYNLKGASLKKQGDFVKAKTSFLKAIEFKPNSANLHNNLGLTLDALDDYKGAISRFKEAIRLNPNDAEFNANLGNSLFSLGDYASALIYYENALSINPKCPKVFNSIGNVYAAEGKLSDSLNFFKKAIILKPDFFGAHNNIANILKELGEYQEALKHYDRAIALDATFSDSFYNKANLLVKLNKHSEALEYYQTALKLNNMFLDCYLNMGNCLRDQGNLVQAIEAYKAALKIDPSFSDASLNLGLVKLKMTCWSEGWRLNENRFLVKESPADYLVSKRPVWKKEHVKSLFVWGEQGIGDEIMFSSCLRELHEYTNNVIVSCDERLIPLYKRSFHNSISFIRKDHFLSENLYDCQVSLGTAFGYLRQDLSQFKRGRCSFIKADPNKVAFLKDLLQNAASGRRIIGISWRSSSAKDQYSRSLSLEQLVNCFPEDTLLVNLQYGDHAREIENVKKVCGRDIFIIKQIDNFNDLDGLAALIQACDEVVSVDNSTVHFAGAMGVKCSVLLPASHTSDWRWGVHGTKRSYMYQNITLYWQKNHGDWSKCLIDLTNDIQCPQMAR